ncbi:WYL domain-containing protein [Campylobacter sp. JMF_01 NE2]|uniref:WYL domain-containing protein n=1 Tax=unclassified Campylobacter TaxID=2593542 RepID=UPI0022E9BB6A|nr:MULTISPECIES: WYL domain-containing protein [unclassified Campylobacter]MDA3052856.1 WYL domain-containing protein [Campylobacter sp. JMF_03 NE3]MDA3067187.1 WYL domain-containing protein [Campylobacter sp. JMF_01 NE2]
MQNNDDYFIANSGNSYYDVLYVLKQLNDNGQIHIENVKEYLGKDERTIARYIKAINDVVGEGRKICRKEGECYVAKTKKLLEFDPAIFTALALICNMLDDKQRKFIFKNIDEKILTAIKSEMNELQKNYKFLSKPFEKVSLKTLEELKFPLEESRRISLDYLGEKFTFKPYKIVFIDENFYLAGLDESDKFKMLRISNIKNIQLKNKFNKDDKSSVISFIDRHMQTSWTDFTKFEMGEFIDIKLCVNSSVARYFTDKKPFLKSQKIECECENGDKIVSYRVTQFMEIKPFIKKWLPSIEVIEPVQLRDEILGELREYLAKKD